jgi:hypothetical protein
MCWAVMAILCASVATAQGDSQQYQAKAKFLAIAPGFVVWPGVTFKLNGAPLQICVHGDFSFGTSLAEFTRSATMQGHQIGGQLGTERTGPANLSHCVCKPVRGEAL